MAADLDLLRRSILQTLREKTTGLTHRKVWEWVGPCTYTPGQVEQMLFKLQGEGLLVTYRAGGMEYWSLKENSVVPILRTPTKAEMIAAMKGVLEFAGAGTAIHPGSEVLEPLKDILKRFGVRA